MRMSFLAKVHLAALVLLACPLTASAQQAPAAGGQAQAAPPAPPPYRLGIEDVMIGMVQPRHIRVALAVRQKNWEYAAFEAKELKDTFTRIERLYPTISRKPIGPMLDDIKEPLEALEAATKAANLKAYQAAYKRVTDGCNACHKTNNVSMVVIVDRNPSNMWPDQDFRPRKSLRPTSNTQSQTN